MFTVEKYGGRVYCGNAFTDTITEALTFIDDGFCDKGKIKDTETGKEYTIKIKE